jgi:hypothetical protein
MDKKGGQAFPRTGFHKEQDGMTLRDYFAAKAMQALIAKGMDNPNNRNAKGVPVIANFSYEYADAMLAERNK